MCVYDHSYVCTGVGHTDEPAYFLLKQKKVNFFLCSGRVSNLVSVDLESNALPPRHIFADYCNLLINEIMDTFQS